MRTLIVIETVEELVRYAKKIRCEGDKDPILPDNAKLIIENNMIRLEAEGFLMDTIEIEDILEVFTNMTGIVIEHIP